MMIDFLKKQKTEWIIRCNESSLQLALPPNMQMFVFLFPIVSKELVFL